MVEDSLYGDTECRVAAVTVVAIFRRHRGCADGFAVRTGRDALPADALQMGDAVGFLRELAVYTDNVHGYLLLVRI